jgi:hypothetical protein
MNIEELGADDFGFDEFVSEHVKRTVGELVYQFGTTSVAAHSEEILHLFSEELNKYLKILP